KRVFDVIYAVEEVQYKQIFSLLGQFRRRAVKTRQCLYTQYRGQLLINVHSTEFWLIKPSEVFIGDHQQAIFISVKFVFGIVVRKTIHIGFGVLNTVNLFGARERDDGLKWRTTLL